MSEHPSRQPKGLPVGGQFAASARAEADLDLTDDAYAVPDEGTRQIDAPFERLHLETSNRGARELARLIQEGQIDPSPEYQRGHVWTLEQRIRLVESWCRGIPVPAVMVNDRTNGDWVRNYGAEHLSTGRAMWAVIDGKQRLETARAWFAGEFAVPASWFPDAEVEHITATSDGPYVTYRGLTKRGQTVMAMTGSMQPVTTAKVGSLEAEADLYLLVNGGGTAQTDADMLNAAAYAGSAPETSDVRHRKSRGQG